MTDDFQKEQLIAARYGEKDRPENIIWNKQIEGLLCHRSVRSFSPQPLPEYWFETWWQPHSLPQHPQIYSNGA